MNSKFPSLLKCFLFTLKQCTTNLACAPFFCFAIFFYSFYYCWPYMEQLPDHLNVVAVDQDNSALSRRLTQAMRASPSLQVTQQTTSLPEAENLMRKGGISAILIIPPDFEINTLTNVPTALVLVTNGAFIVKSRGSMSGVGGPLQKIVAASISAHLVEHGVPLSEIARAANNPPSMIVQSMFNTVNGYLNFTVPIVFMIIFQTVFVCGIGMLMNDWFWKKSTISSCPRRPPPDVFSGHVRSVFLSESVLDPVYRGAVILLPWGELIQKRAGHDCRFNDLRLYHYFPRLAHRGLFKALPICCSNRRTFLDPVCIYFRQPVSMAKHSLASAGFRMAFSNDRRSICHASSISGRSLAFGRCLPVFNTPSASRSNIPNGRLYSDLQDSERPSVSCRNGRSEERHCGRETCT